MEEASEVETPTQKLDISKEVSNFISFCFEYSSRKQLSIDGIEVIRESYLISDVCHIDVYTLPKKKGFVVDVSKGLMEESHSFYYCATEGVLGGVLGRIIQKGV